MVLTRISVPTAFPPAVNTCARTSKKLVSETVWLKSVHVITNPPFASVAIT